MPFFIRKKIKPVFIHISKNAGTSIINTARNSIIVAGHQTAMNWLAKNKQEGPLFAVIRNPFDRVVSEYFYRKRRYDSGERNAHLANLDKTFEEWVVATFVDGEFRTRGSLNQRGISYNPNYMIDDSLIWFISQKCWISDLEGNILVETLLRFETLGKDWEAFSKQYKIKKLLKCYNTSPRERSYHKYYSQQSRKIVENYFQEDLESFHYQF